MKHTKWPSALAYDEMNIQVKGMSNYEKQMCHQRVDGPWGLAILSSNDQCAHPYSWSM